MSDALQRRIAFARTCFLRACQLDVAVRKPGNVSVLSPGHRMQAGLFVASAHAAVGPLFAPAARVGERIEHAVEASWAAAGCNTNLGILLLAAPIALAIESSDALCGAAALRAAIERVLAELDLDDTRATYRAIARANPGGLGDAPREDVHSVPSLDLRAAMALAAARDNIARQYANGYAELFEIALPLLHPGFSLMAMGEHDDADSATRAQVQRVFLGLLSRMDDSHIVRKHGEAVAHTVMRAAQAWQAHPAPDAEPAFAAWDESLKTASINPGTSADFTVTTLLLGGLLDGSGTGPA
jgi:triphosphoribosyl-dephospho-CoA synthase